MILRMLFSLAYSLARFLAELLLVRHRSDARLRAEVLALRHQLRVLERQAGRPRCQPVPSRNPRHRSVGDQGWPADAEWRAFGAGAGGPGPAQRPPCWTEPRIRTRAASPNPGFLDPTGWRGMASTSPA